MKYAVFTVCMPEYPMVKVPGLLKEWGYDGVEWRITNQNDAPKPSFWSGNRTTIMESEALAKAPEVKRLCKEAGIAMPSLGTYTSSGGDILKRVPYLMETANVLGCKSMRVSTQHFDGSKSFNAMWKDASKLYAKVEKLAEKYKVRTLVEMHPNTLTASASSALRFVTPFDPKNVGVIYDVGNQSREGMEHFRAGLEMLGKYMGHVHMKNGKWVTAGKEADGKVKWANKPATLWGGLLDIEKFMETLVLLGYDGWISLEDFTKGSSKKKLVADVKYLRKLEARAKAKK
jgi:sugar phosphate isomerase/epimerase